MKTGKRIVSAWLAGCMCFLLLLGNRRLISAAETDFAEEEMDQVTIEEAVREDVTIDSLDVAYETVDWAVSGERKMEASQKMRKNEIVLVLDVSGSMGGAPLNQLKKACYNFVDDILAEDPDVGISIVTFEDRVRTYTFDGEYFTNSRSDLRSVIRSLSPLGGTAMNAGLAEGDNVLQTYGEAAQQYLIVMADGMPNEGTAYSGPGARYEGTEYVDPKGNAFTYSGSPYCSAVYNTFHGIQSEYIIYSLGYFHSLRGTDKQFAATFMNDIQNNGYIEVSDADQITFSFEGLADNINTDMVSMSVSSLALKPNETKGLSVVFSDAYTSKDREVTWSTKNPAVASVNENGTVTAVREGTAEITASVGGYTAVCKVTVTKEKTSGTLKLYILQNENDQSRDRDNYKKASNAIVTYDGVEYKADSNGQVAVPKHKSGEIQVSKERFKTRSIAFANLTDNQKIYLQKASDNPSIHAVWVNTVNVLSEDYPVGSEAGAISISVDVDWGNADSGTLQLGQEAVFVDFPAGKTTLSFQIHDAFDVSKDIYLIAKNAKGNTVKRHLSFMLDSAAAGMDGFEVSFGDDIKLTIPDAVPFLGGSELSLDILQNEILPVTVSVEDGKVKAALGIDIDKTSYDSTIDGDGNKKEEWESTNVGEQYKNLKSNVNDFVRSVKNLKNAKPGSVSNTWNNIKKKYGDDIAKKKGSFGVESDIQVLGYAEGYLDENRKIRITEAGLYLVISAKADWSGNMSVMVVVVPVPVYWEASVGGEVKAGFNMSYDAGKKKYVPNGEISAKLEGSVGGGLGNTNIATIGGGGKASISPQVKFYYGKENYYAATLAINAYFKLTALGIYEKTWEPEGLKKEWTIDNGVESIGLAMEEAFDTKELYRAEDYAVADLSYLDEAGASMKAIPASNTENGYAQDVLMVQENALSETSPQIKEFEDGKKIAIWFHAPEADVNAVTLYYSYFDGKSWSAPAPVEQDGTPDLCAQLYVSGNDTCMVVWEDTREALSEANDSLQELQQVEIQAAEFDFANARFSEAVSLSSNSQSLPSMPVISGDNGMIHVSWVENSAMDWFGIKGTNSILTNTYSGGKWSEPVVSYDGIEGAILCLASDTNGSAHNLAYAIDADRDFGTVSDQEIYLNGTKITDNEVSDRNVTFENHVLYWSQEGDVVYRKDLTSPQTESVLGEHRFAYTDYRVVCDGSTEAVLFLAPDGMKNSILGVIKTEEGWSEPIQISDPESSTEITDFSACWSEGALQMLCNRVNIKGEMDYEHSAAELYGQTDVLLTEYRPGQSVSIRDAVFDTEEIAEGLMEVALSVKNSSIEKMTGLHVAVTDADGRILQESDIQNTMQAGETAEILFPMVVPTEQIGKTVSIHVTPTGSSKTLPDGGVDIVLSYEDIAVDHAYWAYDGNGTVTVLADVTNNGFENAENVKVNLRKGSASGDILQSAVITKIEAQSKVSIGFDAVPFEKDTMYYVTADAPGTDKNAGNNDDFVALSNDKAVSGRTLTSITASLGKTNYTAGETLTLNDLAVIGTYSDGSRSNVTADAVIDTNSVNMAVEGTYQILISYEGKTAAVPIVVTKAAEVQKPGTNPPVTAPTKGKILKSGDIQYKVTSNPGQTATVTVLKHQKKASVRKVIIPAVVTSNGVKYKVTAINTGVFQDAKKLQSVTIGTNVTTIGKKAFYGCKKLKSVTIKSKSLKKVGSKAFGKIHTKATYKVPKKKYNAYKKLLSAKKAGYVKTQKIKKG